MSPRLPGRSTQGGGGGGGLTSTVIIWVGSLVCGLIVWCAVATYYVERCLYIYAYAYAYVHFEVDTLSLHI